ncbi:hypothetical protein [Flavobacterium sp. LC2016-12]|uniref:hypothetical protein n=1 Tax=Flavobacterium sp. LC2016-12 TaxID=2783794 RepID=UPI00188A3D84|nr:hypothetical protein [Flavobacterium sp. LC2016-12]MBF4466889.1 hypothetical protein [Flavobacterium sp. LC2016-12]
MRKFLFLILLLAQNSFSQSYEKNAKCVRTKNLSEQQRLNQFPFSKSSQIKIISFKDNLEEVSGQGLIKHTHSIKLGKDVFNPELYNETATLTSEQINKLTDIIFNFTYKKMPYAAEDIKCYMPRNAVLFLDADNRIIGYLEICFSCKHFRSSDKRLSIGEYCSTKYDMLKSIFENVNIKYGISEIE